MDKNRTTTTGDDAAEAPLERSVAWRYAQLSPLSRSEEILSRGESLSAMAETRSTLAAEIFGRWGRGATGGREQLPFVAGFTRSGAESDVVTLADEPSAEVGSSAAPQDAGRLPRLRTRQEPTGTGGKELPPLAPKATASITGSPAQRPSGAVNRDDSMATLSQPQTASAEESPAVSLPVAAIPSHGVVRSVTAGIISRRSESQPDRTSSTPSGLGTPLVRQPREAAPIGGTSPAERSASGSPDALPVMANSTAYVNPAVSVVSASAAGAGVPGRLVPVVTRLSESRETAELPVTGSAVGTSGTAGESVAMEASRGHADHGKRPVLLRKLASGGSGGDTPAAELGGMSRQVNNLGQAVSAFPMVNRPGEPVGERVTETYNHELPVTAIGRSQGSQVAAAQPVRPMADDPLASLGSEMVRRMTGNRRQPEVTAFEGPVTGNAEVPMSASSMPLGIGRQTVKAPAEVLAEAPHSFVQRSSADDLYPVSGQLAEMPALNRSLEQQPATEATVTAPAADATPSSRQSGLSREDLSQLAELVYMVIEQRLIIEKERRGL